jgi:hypothetical protein
VCQQLSDVGLIQWKPLRGAASFAGMAKITGRGVAAVESGQCDAIDIRFPSADAPAKAPSSMEEANLQDKPIAPPFAEAAAVREWITAAEASQLLKPAFGNESIARRTICKRAHAGVVPARAERYEQGADFIRENFVIPKEFWWAEGAPALEQNWIAGDFETWINHEFHLKAFGVTFARRDIEKLLPAAATETTTAPPVAKGGRRPADWWEDLLIDICFRHFRGDLKPGSQADVQRAMEEWITAQDYTAGESTVRIRARKVWQAIKREDEN